MLPTLSVKQLICRRYGLPKRMLLTGHIGKLIKVAGGIMNTHSREADWQDRAFDGICV